MTTSSRNITGQDVLAAAGTPEEAEIALEHSRQQNVKLYMQQGMEEPEARTKAMANMLSAKRKLGLK